MYVLMYVSINVGIYINVWVYVGVYLCMYICYNVWIYVCTYVCMSVFFLCVCMYVYLNICMYESKNVCMNVCEYIWMYVCMSFLYIYRVSQEESASLRESVPYVKVYRYNPKHLYSMLNFTEIMVWKTWGLFAVPNTATCTADASRDSVDDLESGLQC